MGKEYASLSFTVGLVEERDALLAEIADLDALEEENSAGGGGGAASEGSAADMEELRAMAEEEKREAVVKLEGLDEQIVRQLTPK